MSKSYNYICPFTKEIITGKLAVFLKKKNLEINMPIDEIRYLVYKETFGEKYTTIENFKHLYEHCKWSLPDFRTNTGMHYNITLFLIEYHGCKKRDRSDAAKNADSKKRKTSMEKYGVDHNFKCVEVQKKRRETYIKKYGVDNPFKQKNFCDKIEQSFINKYGCGRKQWRSIKSKEAWTKKTDDDKQSWLDNSILHIDKRSSSYRISNLEKKVGEILLNLDIAFCAQFKIASFFFDYYISDINLLIEVNGDYFHANPKMYKPTDIISKVKRTASEIWAKDKLKLDTAHEKGYNLLTIWETDIKFMSDKEIATFIYEKIKNKEYNKTPKDG